MCVMTRRALWRVDSVAVSATAPEVNKELASISEGAISAKKGRQEGRAQMMRSCTCSSRLHNSNHKARRQIADS